MSLNCAEIKGMFVESKKKINKNHIEDYEYCRLLYENAKRRKRFDGRNYQHYTRSDSTRKFANIHMFLKELETEGAFDNDAYMSDSDYSEIWCGRSEGSSRVSSLTNEELILARRKQKVHSSQNSDYSFWSLNSSIVSRSNSFNNPGLESNYTDLLRLQSRYFYVY